MGYRDGVEALRARRDALRAQLRDDHDAAVAAELDEVRERLDEMLRLGAQSLVNSARGAKHCPVSWDGMVGDDTIRSCALCDKKVYDLSGMTALEAATLLIRSEGDLCARLWRRRDGTVLTSDCDVGRVRRRRRLAVVGGALGAIGALGALVAQPEEVPAPPPPVARSAPDFDEEMFLHGPQVEEWVETAEAERVTLDSFGWYVTIDDQAFLAPEEAQAIVLLIEEEADADGEL